MAMTSRCRSRLFRRGPFRVQTERNWEQLKDPAVALQRRITRHKPVLFRWGPGGRRSRAVQFLRLSEKRCLAPCRR
jgi:hypothetical protein